MSEPLTNSATASAVTVLPDRRQSAAALDIQRGVCRCLCALNIAAVREMPLASGRRADILALSAKGEFWIVEIKSSVADFRCDLKWPEYSAFCDRFLFAVGPDFPVQLLPADAGLIIADRYGAEVIRMPPSSPMAGSRRRGLLLDFARVAAMRLSCAIDPALMPNSEL